MYPACTLLAALVVRAEHQAILEGVARTIARLIYLAANCVRLCVAIMLTIDRFAELWRPVEQGAHPACAGAAIAGGNTT
jgi:hypothetical protein